MKDLQRIGGFWKKTSESGKTFLSGQIEVSGTKIKLLVFPNGYKEADKQPDYIAYLAEAQEAPPKVADDGFPF